MKIILITGCLGFIGSHFTEKCLRNNWIVIGVDNNTYASDSNILNNFIKNVNFIFINKDICELDHIPDCDYIINFAAESHVENSILDNEKFIKTNVVGTNNLLNLLKNKSTNTYHAPIFIQISTDEVYGDAPFGVFDELATFNPSNPYSASKASADMILTSFARTYDMKYFIIRPTNNYGIRQYPEKLIPIVVKNLLRNKKIKMHNNGEPIRNWLHVEDTVDAIIAIMQNGSINNVYNVAGTIEQKNKNTIMKIIRAFHGNTVAWTDYVQVGEERSGQDVRYSLNDSKVRGLGWKPTRMFDDEIVKIVEWYKKNMRWA